MAEYQTFEHDVLVIGAGGAGLSAAVEACSMGVKVGVITKSLLGKAHTVMAEGGVAAAMANVDDRDNWFAWLSLFWVGFTDLYVRL
ncbi:MAG: FAD-binding protein, partial [Bryobacteraceae bacterium]